MGKWLKVKSKSNSSWLPQSLIKFKISLLYYWLGDYWFTHYWLLTFSQSHWHWLSDWQGHWDWHWQWPWEWQSVTGTVTVSECMRLSDRRWQSLTDWLWARLSDPKSCNDTHTHSDSHSDTHWLSNSPVRHHHSWLFCVHFTHGLTDWLSNSTQSWVIHSLSE